MQSKMMAQRRDLSGAEKLLRASLAAHPAAYTVARALAELLAKRDQRKAGAEILAKAARETGEAKHLFDASTLALDAGEIVLAAQLIDESIVKDPKNLEARIQLGRLLMSYGDSSRASAVLGPVVQQDPFNLPALEMLASIQVGAQARIVDLTIFHHLLKVSPDRRRALQLLAVAERYAGKLTDAVQHSREALDPRSPDSCASHADLLELSGQGDEGLRILEPHGKGTGVLSPHVAMVLARLLVRAKRVDEALAILDRGLAAPNIPPSSVSSISLQRGSALSKLGRFDEAWEAWSYAKLIQAGAYDHAADVARIDRVREAFSKASVEGLARGPAGSPRPVLVLGMYRSGTTLMEQILTMHPAIGGADEVPFLGRFANGIALNPAWKEEWSEERAKQLGDGYRALLRHGNPDRPVVVDKNPRNWESVGLASLVCPDAVVIHMDRHPLDVCVSCMATGFASANIFAAEPKSFAQGFALQVETMEKWKAEAPLPMMTLRYEDLVREPERRIREVLEFIGLPWDPICLDFWKSERIAFTPSQDQVREPLNPRSMGRWRKFAKQLEPAREYLESRGISCAER